MASLSTVPARWNVPTSSLSHAWVKENSNQGWMLAPVYTRILELLKQCSVDERHRSFRTPKKGNPIMKRTMVLVLAIAAAGIAATAGSATADPRSGVLHVTKDCSQYTFQAGSFCTITSSNINAITPGSKVVYASAANFALGVLDSDLVIDGPGNNTAFGHVVLDLSTLTGIVTLSGGTGVFTHFRAGPLAVACPAYPVCSWVGPYSFGPIG